MADADDLLLQNLRWYLGRDAVEQDASMVTSGRPIALLGRVDDDVVGFADRLAPARPVLDLMDGRRPTVHALRHWFAEHPDSFILAPRVDHLVARIGLLAQPWYIAVSPLSARLEQCVPLLRTAIRDLAVTEPLECLGRHVVEGLAAYDWPHGLRELRATAWRLAAVLQSRTLREAAAALKMRRQSLSAYLGKRIQSQLPR